MIVTIETRAKSCPGVFKAVDLAEETLRKKGALISVGQLIHNRREMERLQGLGLELIENGQLESYNKNTGEKNAYFLIRAHGEITETIEKAQLAGLEIVNATCQIVQHSQKLIEQHIVDGWRIVIVGKKNHAEVLSLISRTRGTGIVISSVEEISQHDIEERTLLIAQTTVDPELFAEIRKRLSEKIRELKVVDTTCRFLKTRQSDIQEFAKTQDVIIVVGGKNSSNLNLLYSISKSVNLRSYFVESPEDVDLDWFQGAKRVGITGGASTPRWQLEEMKHFLENQNFEENPNGLKNTKGGKNSWWMWKNHKKK